VDCVGSVYVADTGNNRIQKFRNDGTFVAAWGARGGGAGQFLEPSAIAFDSKGNIYVTDKGNHRVQIFHRLYREIIALPAILK
jgi:DNA-binding beta-propeller fold protein YncE